jgi:hypothetical protein
VFFASFGFAADRWQVLAEALRNHAATHPISSIAPSRYGTKYRVDGPLLCPGGRWIIDAGTDRPRLVTAHPLYYPAPMIHEHNRVVLTAPVTDEGLEPGDIGAVVHIYPRHEAYEVEFVTLTGRTAAVVTVSAEQVRPVSSGEIPHARELAHR